MESTESQLLHAWRLYALSSMRTLCVKNIYIVDEEENERKLIYKRGIFKVQKYRQRKQLEKLRHEVKRLQDWYWKQRGKWKEKFM